MIVHKACGDVAALVPAAGLGVRLGPGGPKALRLLAGVPLLVRVIRCLSSAPCVGHIVVAAPPEEVDAVRVLLAPVMSDPMMLDVVAGGASRQASVAAALAAVPASYDLVLVHDAARALVPSDLVERVAAAVRAGHPAVVPALPVADTIKEVDGSGWVVGTTDRSALRSVQTPQGFRRAVLISAHAAAVDDHTDDAGLVEKLGIQVLTIPGDEAALKITGPFDLAVAELLLARAEQGRD